jgi:hypothetical protein
LRQGIIIAYSGAPHRLPYPEFLFLPGLIRGEITVHQVRDGTGLAVLLGQGEGRPFTPTMVQRVIRTYQLPSRRQRLLDADLIPLSQMAQQFGVSTSTIKIWHHAEIVSGQTKRCALTYKNRVRTA